MKKSIAAIHLSVEALKKATAELGDKASWSPSDKGRTALDQVAECALITGACTGIIQHKAVPEIDWAVFSENKIKLAADADAALASLTSNTEGFAAALEGLSAEDAAIEVTMPWGATYTLAGLADVVYWNNTYHEGQINYISTLV
ncbi:hypothetical protein [Armatimonas sp.]|uniref:hypothetical protein n=1 Tax=Armatimonas sp. TaxID=1872638 RepID=UPI0037509334